MFTVFAGDLASPTLKETTIKEASWTLLISSGGFFLVCDDLGMRVLSLMNHSPACAFFSFFCKWRSVQAHQFHFTGQYQCIVAQWAEITVDKHSLTSCMWDHFSTKFPHYAWHRKEEKVNDFWWDWHSWKELRKCTHQLTTKVTWHPWGTAMLVHSLPTKSRKKLAHGTI